MESNNFEVKNIDNNEYKTSGFTLQTIKGKLIVSVIILVFVIQFIASLIQYYQMRSIFFEGLTLEALAVSLPATLELGKKLDWQFQTATKDVLEAEEVLSVGEVFISAFGFNRFKPLVEEHDRLIKVMFVSYKGDIMAHSDEENEAEAISEELMDFIGQKKLKFFEKDGNVFVFVPYEYQNKRNQQSYALGGTLLEYTGEYLTEKRNLMLWVSLFLLACFVILSAIIAYFIALAITKPIQTVSNGLQDISHGERDLTQRIKYTFKGEVGRLAHYFNEFMKKIHQTLADIKTNANQLAVDSQELQGTAVQINQISVKVAEGTKKEAQSISETKQTLDTILASNQSIADHVNHIQQRASKAQEEAILGNEKIRLTHESMDKISDSAKKIQSIIDVITEIANQTNLLSLNAMIEATKAGDAGKGFAVVAEEIRKLADRSNHSATEIRNLITASETNVSEGIHVVEETAGFMEQIIGHVTDFSEQINVLVANNDSQNFRIQDIGKEIQNIDLISQNNDQSTQHLSKIFKEVELTTHNIAQMAKTLNQEVDYFRT